MDKVIFFPYVTHEGDTGIHGEYYFSVFEMLEYLTSESPSSLVVPVENYTGMSNTSTAAANTSCYKTGS